MSGDGKKLAVFYHIWTSREPLVARFLVDEQIKRILRSGLREVADVFCVIAGENQDILDAVIKHYKWVKVLETYCPATEYEFGTLKYLYSACLESRYESVLYLHTKGVQYFSQPAMTATPGQLNMPAINSWRHYMEYFVVDQWQTAVDFLKSYKAAGCCLLDDAGEIFFAGNFWWAKSDYIKTLPDPRSYIAIEDKGDGLKRHGAERWLGTNAVFQDFRILAGIKLPDDAEDTSHDLYFSDIQFTYLPQLESVTNPS